MMNEITRGDTVLGTNLESRQAEKYGRQISSIVGDVLHEGEREKTHRLTRILQTFVETLQNNCSINPRFVGFLNEEVTSNPDFQSILFDTALMYTRDGRIEEFLWLSMEYPTIFQIREAILQNDSIQSLVRERLVLMEEKEQCGVVDILRNYLREEC